MAEPKVGLLEYATVVSVEPHNNLISVKLESAEASTEIFEAIVFTGNKVPRAGAQGIVAILGANAQKMFWIGGIGDVVQDIRNPSQPSINPDDIVLMNEKKTSSLKISTDIIAITNPHSSFLCSKNGLTITQASQSLNYSEREFDVKTTQSRLRLSDQSFVIQTPGSINLLGGSDFNIAAKNNVVISSGLYDSKASNFYDQYGAANRFFLNAIESVVHIGNTMVVDVGAMIINACSGQILGGFPPGTGSKTTVTLNIIEGDMITSTSAGDIELNCLSEANSISIYAGRKPTGPTYSELKLSSDKAILENFSGTRAKMTLSEGNAKLETDNDIEMSPLQKFTVDAMMDVEIKTKTQATIQATTILALKGESQITTDTGILDFTNAKVWKTGPKTAIPTGTGPLCAIQICPILGIPHTGEMCNG